MTQIVRVYFFSFTFVLSQSHSPPTYNLFTYLFLLRETPVGQVESENTWNAHRFHWLALLLWHDKTPLL